MKKGSLLIAALVLMAVCAPVMAQTFTDVPVDHWAYQAVQDLADKGYVIGYPDGTFSGKRALTRYEFAMALSRVVAKITQTVETGGISPADLDALGNRISALENKTTPGAPSLPVDLDKINRLVNEFRDELATLGVDVDALKRDIADLRTRTSAIEETIRHMPKFSAEFNTYFRGESTRTGYQAPIDWDGRTLDPDNNLLQGVRGLYDLDLRVDGYVSDKIRAHALINAGNYVNWLNNEILGSFAPGTFRFDNPISVPPYIAGSPFSPSTAPDQLRLWLMYAETPLGGSLMGSNLTVGKFPFQLSPYFLRMPDVDSYTYNYKTDSGDYPMLGAALNAKLGPVGVTAFASKQQDNLVPFVGGYGVPLNINQTAGVRLNMGVPFLGNLALNYMQSGLNQLSFAAPNAAADYAWWGADMNTTLPWYGIGLAATWAQSQPQDSGGGMVAGFGDRSAVDAKLSIPLGTMTVGGGYRRIDPNFSTPGYWGKIGYLTNPVDIEGPTANLSVPVYKDLVFNATGEWYHGLGATYNPGLFPAGFGFGPGAVGVIIPDLAGGDNLKHYVAGFSYSLSSANKVDLGYEEVRYRPSGLDVSRQTFINVGFGHDFNTNTSVKLLYQFVTEKNVNAATHPFWGPRDGQGNVAITQVSVKF
jgi:hypothetical protein